MTTRGSTRGSDPVVFRSPSVSPQTGVTSDPAYVVGTAMTGRPVVSATALAVPVADPPPMLSSASAPVTAACCRAAPAASAGTCSRTPVNTPASWPPSGVASSRASGSARGVVISSSRDAPSRLTSPASRARAVPAPNTTRPGSAS